MQSILLIHFSPLTDQTGEGRWHLEGIVAEAQTWTIRAHHPKMGTPEGVTCAGGDMSNDCTRWWQQKEILLCRWDFQGVVSPINNAIHLKSAESIHIRIFKCCPL